MRLHALLVACGPVALGVAALACSPRGSGASGSASATASSSPQKSARSAASEGAAHLKSGIKLHREGKNADAEAELLRAIETGTLTVAETAQAWTIVGLTREERDDYARAIEAHDKAIALKDDYEVAWVNKGIALRLDKRPDEAKKAYEKALAINDEYAEAWASLGALYLLHDKEPKKAVDALEKAIELDAKLAVAHANISLAYAELGRFDDADAALKRAVEKGYKNEARMREMIDGARAKKK